MKLKTEPFGDAQALAFRMGSRRGDLKIKSEGMVCFVYSNYLVYLVYLVYSVI
jgi:hypothetical protein